MLLTPPPPLKLSPLPPPPSPDLLGVAVFGQVGGAIAVSIRQAMEALFGTAFSSPKAFGEFIKNTFGFIWDATKWFWNNSETVIGAWIAVWTSVLSFVLYNDGFGTALMLFTSGVMNLTSMVGLAVPGIALANIFAKQALDMVQSAVKVAFKKALDDIRNFFKKVEDELNKVWQHIRSFFDSIKRFFTGQGDLEMLQLSYEMLSLQLDTLGTISPASAPAIASMKTTAASMLQEAEKAHEDRKLLGASADVAAKTQTISQLQQKMLMQYQLLSQSLTV